VEDRHLHFYGSWDNLDAFDEPLKLLRGHYPV